ncbi:MAG: hypothetical protein QXE57_05055 [Nitrososphaerales archaeon]
MAKSANTQKRVLQYLLNHNFEASPKEVAAALNLTYWSAAHALSRLRRKPLNQYCPICFQPTLVPDYSEKICKVCGFVIHNGDFTQHSSEVYNSVAGNNLHLNKKLGTSTPYALLRKKGIITNSASVLEMKVDDAFTVKVMSMLWSLIKDLNLDYATTDHLARIARKKIGKLVHNRAAIKRILKETLEEASIPKAQIALQRLEYY